MCRETPADAPRGIKVVPYLDTIDLASGCSDRIVESQILEGQGPVYSR